MRSLAVVLLASFAISQAIAVDIGKGWEATFSKGDGQSENVLPLTQVPDLPKPIAKPGGCKFKFPQNGHVNYLVRRAQGGAKKFVVVKMKISGNAKFIPLDGGSPATAHVYLDEADITNRWWAKPQWFDLQKMLNKGVVTLTIPFTPENWGNVNGQPGNYNADTLAQFKRVLGSMGHVGVTFGGWSQWGHGVKIKNGGTAECYIVSVTFSD